MYLRTGQVKGCCSTFTVSKAEAKKTTAGFQTDTRTKTKGVLRLFRIF